MGDGEAALDFYKRAFGAVERLRLMWGDKLGHAEFTIGNAVVMMASEFPELGAVSPHTVGGTPVSMAIYTEDVDEMFARAVREGATEVRPVENHFYGDRMGTLDDPFGHRWSIATHVEDVSPEELARRSEAAQAEFGDSE